MVQVANMGVGVAEPVPMALKMMIQMVAKFKGPRSAYVRARACASVMCACASDEEWIIKVSAF